MSVRSGSIVLPEWQDDSEVSACPICQRKFYFLFRKHHCRRCGRIICDQCSPHRITIPRQYIVRPPWEAVSYRVETDEAGNEYFNPALGGGETVRVCNPCVPDPNYGPPPSQGDQTLSRAQSGGTTAPEPPAQNERSIQQRAATYQGSHPSPERPRMRPSFSSGVTGRRPRGSSDATTGTQAGAGAQNIPPPSQSSRRTGHRPSASASFSASRILFPASPRDTPASSGRLVVHRRPAPAFREEDECPVCGTHDPPFGPSSDQAAREAHIEACINGHLQFSSTPRSSSIHPGTTPPAEAAPATPPTAPTPQPRSTQRMLTYHATEKDCHDENGRSTECVICLDDFEPGQEVGRLECLCKFHRPCIRGWWESGPPGRERERWGTCPTHALHS